MGSHGIGRVYEKFPPNSFFTSSHTKDWTKTDAEAREISPLYENLSLVHEGQGAGVWAVWLVDVGMKSCFEWGLLSGVIVKLRSLSNQGFHAARRDLAEVPFFWLHGWDSLCFLFCSAQRWF